MGTKNKETIQELNKDMEAKAQAFVDSLKFCTDNEKIMLFSAFQVGYVAGINHERYGS